MAKTYGGLMAPMGENDDQWLASVLTYIRRAWGNDGDPIATKEIDRVRRKDRSRAEPWTEKELL